MIRIGIVGYGNIGFRCYGFYLEIAQPHRDSCVGVPGSGCNGECGGAASCQQISLGSAELIAADCSQRAGAHLGAGIIKANVSCASGGVGHCHGCSFCIGERPLCGNRYGTIGFTDGAVAIHSNFHTGNTSDCYCRCGQCHCKPQGCNHCK